VTLSWAALVCGALALGCWGLLYAGERPTPVLVVTLLSALGVGWLLALMAAGMLVMGALFHRRGIPAGAD
jgi:hypothetical protein